jgi:broad specificity phosphatase PhoE
MMPASTTISFVRHGEFENPDSLYHGRLPGFPLSDRGREEVEAVGAVLAAREDEPIVVIYTSPQLRTRQTAEIIQAGLQPPPPIQEISLLDEIRSPFDGSPREQMEERGWDFYTGTSFPYEQPQDVLQRVLSFIQRMRRLHTNQHVVAVTHADPIAFLWLWLAGEEPAVDKRKRLDEFGMAVHYPQTASLTRLRFRSVSPDERPQYEYQRPFQIPAEQGGGK